MPRERRLSSGGRDIPCFRPRPARCPRNKRKRVLGSGGMREGYVTTGGVMMKQQRKRGRVRASCPAVPRASRENRGKRFGKRDKNVLRGKENGCARRTDHLSVIWSIPFASSFVYGASVPACLYSPTKLLAAVSTTPAPWKITVRNRCRRGRRLSSTLCPGKMPLPKRRQESHEWHEHRESHPRSCRALRYGKGGTR